MGLNDREKAEFLVSTLQGDSSKEIMRAQRIRGELSFKEICSRLESRYERDFSTAAAARLFKKAKNHSSIGPTG